MSDTDWVKYVPNPALVHKGLTYVHMWFSSSTGEGRRERKEERVENREYRMENGERR